MTALTSVLLAEGGLRLLLPVERAILHADEEAYFRYLWLTHQSAHGRADEFTRGNSRVQPDPRLGWRPRENYRPDSGPSRGFVLNSRGVRSAREYADRPASGERRVVVLGDSFTFASFDARVTEPIAPDAVYTARLEAARPATSVVNLGVDGYGVDQMYLYLLAEGLRYGPHVVIAAVFDNDLYRSVLAFRDYAKPRFELRGGALVLTGVPVPEPAEVLRQPVPDPPASYLLALVTRVRREAARDRAPLGSMPADALNEAILDAMHRDVTAAGATFLVVSIPRWDFDLGIGRAERFLRAWGDRAGVPVVSMREHFTTLDPGARATLYDPATRHWTARGHAEAASALAAVIDRPGSSAAR